MPDRKVHFSDHIQVKEMSIDRAAHVQEVKAPKNVIQIVDSNPVVSPKNSVNTIDVSPEVSTGTSNSMWLWIGIIIVVILFLLYLFLSGRKSMNFIR
jgi:LPXTG-motif cell wall-anchored protein